MKQFSLLTNPSVQTDNNENKKIIDINGLKSLRSYEYNIDKETISTAPYFTEKMVTDHSQAFDFSASFPLKTLFLPLISENILTINSFQ